MWGCDFAALSTVLQILTPFMLRRLKTDVDFVIPPKREVIVYAQLSAVQQEMYRCILNKTIAQLVKAPTENTVCCVILCRISSLDGLLWVGHVHVHVTGTLVEPFFTVCHLTNQFNHI